MQGKGGAELKQGRARLEVGARTRTSNMSSMSGMPERSKLSGWLNFAASCRVVSEVIQGGVRCGLGDERAVGAVVVQAARREAARLEVGLRARTPNISFMLVTLDVSKSSGLLNFIASCRVARSYKAG